MDIDKSLIDNSEDSEEKTNEVNKIEVVVSGETMVSNSVKTSDNTAVMSYMSLVFASIVCLIMVKMCRKATKK